MFVRVDCCCCCCWCFSQFCCASLSHLVWLFPGRKSAASNWSSQQHQPNCTPLLHSNRSLMSFIIWLQLLIWLGTIFGFLCFFLLSSLSFSFAADRSVNDCSGTGAGTGCGTTVDRKSQKSKYWHFWFFLSQHTDKKWNWRKSRVVDAGACVSVSASASVWK